MYRGKEPGHFWPKLGGILLVPAAASVATLVVAPLVLGKKLDPNTLTDADKATIGTVSAVSHALGAAASWYASDNLESVGTQAFFRGGMWSEMLSTLFVGGAVLSNAMADKPSAPSAQAKPAVSGIDSKRSLGTLISLLSGGAIPAPAKQVQFRLKGAR